MSETNWTICYGILLQSLLLLMLLLMLLTDDADVNDAVDLDVDDAVASEVLKLL